MLTNVIETYQMRTDMHKEEKALTLRIKAIMRRLTDNDRKEADKLYEAVVKDKDHPLAGPAFTYTEKLFESRDILESKRKELEKSLAKQAKGLPAYDFVQETRGLGELGFAMIIGTAGDLNNFATVARLWKYLGLAVMPDGSRQRRVKGEEAKNHSYSPGNRALIWTLGDSILRTHGHYRDVYDARKDVELQKAADEGLEVIPTAEIKTIEEAGGSTEGYRSVGHVHNRAKRYMEKQLVRDLWCAWRDATMIENAA